MKILLVVSPSGAGKTAMAHSLESRIHNSPCADVLSSDRTRICDLDDLASRSHDNVGNFYDINYILRYAGRRAHAGIEELVLFGLSRNVVDLMKALKVRGARTAFLFSPVDQIVSRRVARGKPFDLSRSRAEHREDVLECTSILLPECDYVVSSADQVEDIYRLWDFNLDPKVDESSPSFLHSIVEVGERHHGN